MIRQLFGVETEYALAAFSEHGDRIAPDIVLPRFIGAARSQVRHMRDGSTNGMFLENGGRFYLDTGFHPEMSTPECEDPWDVLRYVRAGDALMVRFARATLGRSRGRLGAVRVSRHNVDYSRRGCTWGSHESYLVTRSPTDLVDDLVPHLVTRMIYTGAGGFGIDARGPYFVLSPRARFIQREISSDSMSHRGIFHTKDEPLCRGGYHRLHLLCGESLNSDLGLWLRIGTTSIVSRLAQVGLRPKRRVVLLNPVKALAQVATDPDCKRKLSRRIGSPRTAIEIQRGYLELAEERLKRGDLPSWAADVCHAWREVLDKLAEDPAQLAESLDWPAKLALFRRHVERRGGDWSAFMRDSFPDRRKGQPVREMLDGEEDEPFVVLARRPRAGGRDEGPGTASESDARVPPRGAARDAHRNRALQLLELDMRCGELGDEGLFARLARIGVLRHDLLAPAEVERAVSLPPATGRARRRGEAVHELAGRPGLRCNWTRIGAGEEEIVADFSDPFDDGRRVAPDRAAEAS